MLLGTGRIRQPIDVLRRAQRHAHASAAASGLQRPPRRAPGGIHGAGPPPAVGLAQLQSLLPARRARHPPAPGPARARVGQRYNPAMQIAASFWPSCFPTSCEGVPQ